ANGTLFNNYCAFRKSGGSSEFTNATVFASGAAFNQLGGAIDVQNGTNGLEIAFQGGGNFTGGYITTNTFGLTVLSSGNFNLNGTVSGTNTWQYGNLVGTDVINGALTWVAGNWNGANVTIASNALVSISGAADHDVASCIVTNYGSVAWSNGRIRGGGTPGT